jgi:hypothetical protein
MEKAVFKKYEDGYYTFIFDSGLEMIFEEVHPKVIHQYDLRNDRSLIGETFEISFTEIFDDSDEDFVIYRIERLQKI